MSDTGDWNVFRKLSSTRRKWLETAPYWTLKRGWTLPTQSSTKPLTRGLFDYRLCVKSKGHHFNFQAPCCSKPALIRATSDIQNHRKNRWRRTTQNLYKRNHKLSRRLHEGLSAKLSANDDVRKRLLQKPRFVLVAKCVFRLGRCYIFWQGVQAMMMMIDDDDDAACCILCTVRFLEPTKDCVSIYSEGCSRFKRRVLRSSLDQVIDDVADQCDPVVEVNNVIFSHH